MKRYIKGFRRPSGLRAGWHFVLTFIVALAVLLTVRTFFIVQVEVVSERRDLGLLTGDRVLVNRTSYGMRMPMQNQWGYYRFGKCQIKVGDIIAYDYPDGTGRIALDRVIALPGDTLWLEADTVYSVVPEHAYGAGDVVVPESCVVGRPSYISYSVDTRQPFYQKLRPKRLFVEIR